MFSFLKKKIECIVQPQKPMVSEKYSMIATNDKIDPCMDDILIHQMVWARLHSIKGGQTI